MNIVFVLSFFLLFSPFFFFLCVCVCVCVVWWGGRDYYFEPRMILV